MIKLKYFFLFLVFFLSCQPTPDIAPQPEVLEISKATYNGSPILGNRSLFKEKLLNPFSKLDTCRHSKIGLTQEYWIYDCIVPANDKSVTYSTYQEVVFLSKLEFSSSAEKIIMPKLTLSNATTLDTIVKLFPDSYPDIYKSTNAPKRKNPEIAYINDDSPTKKRLDPNHVELMFKDRRLVSFTYYWKPEMTPMQISKSKERYRQGQESLKQQERKNSQ